VVRTQVQFSEDQYERLKALASRRGVSIAELVRRGVERLLDEDRGDEKWRRLLEVAGTVSDEQGATDVAERHDDYLAGLHARKIGRLR